MWFTGWVGCGWKSLGRGGWAQGLESRWAGGGGVGG